LKRFGLAFTIWLAMFALVALVLGLAAIFQSGMIERIYLRQQSDRILERTEELIRTNNETASQSRLEQEVDTLARELGASVIVIDQSARVTSWSSGYGAGRRGMGMGMGPGLGSMMPGRNAPIDQSDLQAVLGGQTVVKKGDSPYFGMDMLLVAAPLKKGGQQSGAVIVHTPLAPIQANLRSINEAVIYSFLLGIAAATLLAFLFSRKVTGPILKINSVARSMAAGDFSRQVTGYPDNELGVLAGSINTLSRELKEKIETLEKIDSARRAFVANISHELRTPLTIMQGYTEALMDGIARDEKQKEKYLLNIYEETIRLRRLVDDLLDLRRLESGQISIRLEAADLARIIEGVAGQFNETATEKKVEVKYLLPGESLLVNGDPDRLKQVVINLVDNAVRFSPENGVVEVRGERLGGKVRVRVRDSGPGMSEEEKGLVWDRFYKSNQYSTGRDSGSGLGLAIARQIIDLHGGEIGVDSSPGEGSVFWFTVETIPGDTVKNIRGGK